VPGLVHVGFVVDSGTGTGFSEFLGFPLSVSYHLTLHTHMSSMG
jgi:hypothetical protein